MRRAECHFTLGNVCEGTKDHPGMGPGCRPWPRGTHEITFALRAHQHVRSTRALSYDAPVFGTGFYNPHLDQIATSDVPVGRNAGEFHKVQLPPRLVLLVSAPILGGLHHHYARMA